MRKIFQGKVHQGFADTYVLFLLGDRTALVNLLVVLGS
jgi:hypothetical protein